MSSDTRVIVLGDELVAGRGDPRAQGWLGRVVARTEPAATITAYPLAMPGETTTALATRWEAETLPRLQPEGNNRLVIGLGWADLDHGVSVARARLNLANLLDKAAALRLPTMVIGPPPRRAEEGEQLSAYSKAFAEVAARRGTPYVEMLAPLANHDQWLADMVGSGYTWPDQTGYGLMAWLVLHNHWNEWVQGSNPAPP